MTQLLTGPPPPEAILAMVGIPRLQIDPSILVTQDGPSGLGPEAAGAVLMLQATFVDPDGAAQFWEAAVPLMALLGEAPGFIRRYSFPDRSNITLLAFWETAEHARAFGASPEHRAAVRDLYRHRWQYSHFSALWELSNSAGRVVFCDACDTVTPAPEGRCQGCGKAFAEAYPTPASSR